MLLSSFATSSSTISLKQQQVEKLVTCASCGLTFNARERLPRRTSCGATVCLQCIKRVNNSNRLQTPLVSSTPRSSMSSLNKSSSLSIVSSSSLSSCSSGCCSFCHKRHALSHETNTTVLSLLKEFNLEDNEVALDAQSAFLLAMKSELMDSINLVNAQFEHTLKRLAVFEHELRARIHERAASLIKCVEASRDELLGACESTLGCDVLELKYRLLKGEIERDIERGMQADGDEAAERIRDKLEYVKELLVDVKLKMSRHAFREGTAQLDANKKALIGELVDDDAVVKSDDYVLEKTIQLKKKCNVFSMIVMRGHLLVCGTRDHLILIYDTTSGSLHHTLQGHTGIVYTLAAGVALTTLLASGAGDGHVKLWHVDGGGGGDESRELKTLVDVKKPASAVSTLVLFNDDQTLATCACDEPVVRVWCVATGTLQRRLTSCSSRVKIHSVMCLAKSFLLCGTDKDTLLLFDCAQQDEPIKVYRDDTTMSALLDKSISGGSSLSSSSSSSSSMLTLEYLYGREAAMKKYECVDAMALLHNGNVVTGSRDYKIRVWNLNEKSIRRSAKGHQGWITALQMLPNGDLATSSCDKTVKIWAVATSMDDDEDEASEVIRLKRTLKGHQKAVTALVVLPDGGLASVSQEDETIRIWSCRKQKV